MSTFVIVLWVIVAAVSINTASSQTCTDPRNNPGVVRRIGDCDMLYTILKKNGKSQKEKELLVQSIRGFDKEMPKVCCPLDKCKTPTGNPGHCVHLKHCFSISSKVIRPKHPSKKEWSFLKKYRCGDDEFNVCCPSSHTKPTPSDPNTIQTKNRMCNPTASPPEPDSGCCGDPGLRDRIYGGSPADIDDHPWLAVIETAYDGNYLCGGALISGLYVLTADHCTKHSRLNAHLGDYNISSPGVDCVQRRGYRECTRGSIIIPVSKIIKYPQQSKKQYNDIALLQLARLVKFGEFIKPICLPSSDITVNPPVGLEFVIAGWGLVDNKYMSSVKMHVKVPFVAVDTCRQYTYSFPTNLGVKHICAGTLGRDSCKGDSGGPLMYFTGSRYEAVGIISRGDTPCGGTNPAIHTKVIEYLYWIKEYAH